MQWYDSLDWYQVGLSLLSFISGALIGYAASRRKEVTTAIMPEQPLPSPEPEQPPPPPPAPGPLPPEHHKGWAPCFHSDKEKTREDQEQARADWIKGIVKDEGWWGDPPPTTIFTGAPSHPALVEKLLWEIAIIGGPVTCVADQWVGVEVKGGEYCEVRKAAWNAPPDEDVPDCDHPDGYCRAITSYIQGDDFTVALVESFRWWKERKPND